MWSSRLVPRRPMAPTQCGWTLTTVTARQPRKHRRSARELGDRTDQRLRAALGARLAREGDLTGRIPTGVPLEPVPLDREGDAVGGQRAATVIDPEVQMRRGGVPAVAEQPDPPTGLQMLAPLDPDRARLHVRVDRVPVRGNPLDDVVAGEIRGLADGGVVHDERPDVRSVV